ncbi:hypothetical protein [Rhizobium leguminosarum]|uniref:hypothetical protein n=1 Tax=Rhizobium leguminosarum TaxID=384 RepID=UPI0017F24951|nr:hypothetical protein [Rhizobium leguminosarum]MBB4345112.1 hypothetical protein [Rhizobium leguminosarum]MBB6298183.1 hypothetical protein [Rhizobium leguminosarum]
MIDFAATVEGPKLIESDIGTLLRIGTVAVILHLVDERDAGNDPALPRPVYRGGADFQRAVHAADVQALGEKVLLEFFLLVQVPDVRDRRRLPELVPVADQDLAALGGRKLAGVIIPVIQQN